MLSADQLRGRVTHRKVKLSRHPSPPPDAATTGREPPPTSAPWQPPPGSANAVQVIVNGDSGSSSLATPDEWNARLTDRFLANGWPVTVRSVPSSEVNAALRTAVAAGPSALIVGGGDGTVLSAVSALQGKPLPLGILPLGTFNTLARDLGLPAAWEEAVDALTRRAAIREIDVARVNGRPFLSLCVIGPLARSAIPEGQGLPWWLKAVRTLGKLLGSYLDHPAMRLQVEASGISSSHRTRLAGISNNPFRDEAGLIVPQRQSLDSGLLTLYLSKHANRRAVMRAGLAFLTGRMSSDPDLLIRPARSIRIDVPYRRRLRLAVDGEPVTETLPLQFTMHPRQLRVLSCLTPEELAQEAA